MRVVIQQPPFMCNMVEFVQMVNADTVIMMGRSQFVKQSTHNRIGCPTIKQGYVTLPVHAPLGTEIKDVHPVNLARWFKAFQKQALQSYQGLVNYAEMVYFVKLLGDYVDLGGQGITLSMFNVYSYMAMVEAFKVREVLGDSNIVVSDLQITLDRPQDASEYVGRLLRLTNASSYVSGKASMDSYLDLNKLPEIPVLYQDYVLPDFAKAYGFSATDSALEFLVRTPKLKYLDLLRDNTYDYRKTDVPLSSRCEGNLLQQSPQR